MDPNNVWSPRSKVSDLKVLCKNREGGFSIALLKWEDNERLAIRWNGADDKKLGYPHSHFKATWFIIPKQLALAYALQSQNMEMAQIITACADYVFE